MGAGSNLPRAFIFFNKFYLFSLNASSFIVSYFCYLFSVDFSFCFIFPHEFSCIAILISKMKLSHKVHKLKSSAADEINIVSIDSS